MYVDLIPSITKSELLFDKANQYIPGGVNSAVRAFGAVGGKPRFIAHANGAYLTDVDGNSYVDYVGSWGPMILGHSHPEVIRAVVSACQKGLSYGAPCPAEVELAEEICLRMPSIEQIRMVNSGTEATMTAIRLARGATGRDKFIKFEGCYHGHADHLLIKAGSGGLTFNQPSSKGVPAQIAEDTLIASYNDIESVSKCFERDGNAIAAVIIEPIAGNMNMILPQSGFLEALKDICMSYGALLIFDEVMTGFRVGICGAQGIYAVQPDLTTLGKVIGGGMPVGAVGGRKDIMCHLAPEGPVYQAGTLSGNPITMVAGLATMRLVTPELFQHLETYTSKLMTGLRERAARAGISMVTHHRGGMFGFFFTEEHEINRYEQVLRCNHHLFRQFFHGMLEHGIYFAPSAYEAGFVSIAHGEAELDKTLSAATVVFNNLSITRP